MRWSACCLTLAFVCALNPARSIAADAKWVHATSEHFDLYTSESEGDAKAALLHLEAVRAYFLAATHSKDPGGQPVRIVAFHSLGDYAKYRPQDIGAPKAYAQPGAVPATIASVGLKPEVYEHIFHEYAQLVMDEDSPSLPYWLRAGLADLYSTLKPGDNTIKLGLQPSRDYRSTGFGDLDLNVMFGIDRAGLQAARNRQGTGFYSDNEAQSAALGAANAARTTALQQSQSAMNQDIVGGIWMLTHMIVFNPEYRPKFGEFVSTLGTGQSTGAVFNSVYGRSINQVAIDLKIYAKQPSLSSANLPYKFDKPSPPQVRPATKEDQDRVMADLARNAK